MWVELCVKPFCYMTTKRRTKTWEKAFNTEIQILQIGLGSGDWGTNNRSKINISLCFILSCQTSFLFPLSLKSCRSNILLHYHFWWQLLQGSSEFIPAGHVSYVPQIESNGSRKQNSLQMFTLSILMLAYTWMNQQMNEWMKEWMNELVSEWVCVWGSEWIKSLFTW